ncbi:hypothetical protein FB381_3387 [Nocardioides albertanoniae]|uniref:Lipoprotein n=1 Tax=Nocardioides albertanoniae TaxID=1175486 RepID=A0A543AAD6_9ACTN|nr:hypothetical protein [Nocardioides albertanoniae]TQL69480.1 hypothetical protein FB381_3387 [Nocardioides albertanoniae]
MARPMWRTTAVVLPAVLACLVAVAGCGEESSPPVSSATAASRSGSVGELVVDGRLTCDKDVSSDEAKTTIERVGGLQQPTWSVRFAESTPAGVVALVAGDLEEARAPLFEDYGVAAILESAEGQSRAEDFGAVREAVRRICG